jgi:hypothetical protein
MTEHQGLAIGHAMAEVAAVNAGNEWVAIALDAVRKHAMTNKYFTTEQVRAAYVDLPEPPDRRAWGAVARKAQKEGLIQSHGWVRAQSLTVHGMVVTMWESKVYLN